MDCVDVCPVDCFYEGENMLVIHPEECIDCGVCEPECPAEAIHPDTKDGTEKWLKINTEYADKWPNITIMKDGPEDGEKYNGEENKFEKIELISIPEARHGFDNPFLFFGITFDNLPSLNIISDKCTLTISKEGKIMNLLGDIIDGPIESEKLLLSCSTPGVRVKYSGSATDITAEAIVSFLEKRFDN